MKVSLSRYLPILFILMLFTVLKTPQLTYPHYWDESWSYSTAVDLMYKNGATMLPGHIDVQATRGHPLFFYASAALWMQIFGDSLLSKHSFALVISLALLLSIYLICLQLYNLRVAIAATLLMGSQIFFFVQSTMLLPEVMVALFALLSLYAFSSCRFILLAISLSLLLLTKESGMTMGFALGIGFLVTLFNATYEPSLKRNMFIGLMVPAIIICLFFGIQKATYGWFLFPEHLGLIDSDIHDFAARFQGSLFVLFIDEKRKWLWFIIAGMGIIYTYQNKKRVDLIWILALLLIFVFKYIALSALKNPYINITLMAILMGYLINRARKLGKEENADRFLLFAVLFTLFYIIFTSINFYTLRYLMAALVITSIGAAILIEKMFIQWSLKLYIPLAMVISVLSVQSYLYNTDMGDTGLGSYDAIKVQMDVIHYLADNNLQDKNIGTGSFQQQINMQQHACGFLKNGKPSFSKVGWAIDSLTDYAVFDNIEVDSRIDSMKNNPEYVLVYKTQYHDAWGKIYKKVK